MQIVYQNMFFYNVKLPFGSKLMVQILLLHTFVIGETSNVIGDQFDPMGEHCQIIDVNNTRIGAIHTSHLESIWPQFVRTEYVSRDVSHQQRYCKHKLGTCNTGPLLHYPYRDVLAWVPCNF